MGKLGPASSLRQVMSDPDHDVCILGDDDVDYPEPQLLRLAEEVRTSGSTILSGAPEQFPRIGWGVTGYSAVAGLCRIFSDIQSSVPVEPSCFLADDVAATHYRECASCR